MLNKKLGSDPKLFEDTWAEDFYQYSSVHLPSYKNVITVKDPSLDQVSLDPFQNENKNQG